MYVYNARHRNGANFFLTNLGSLYFLWPNYFVSVAIYIYRVGWDSNRGTLSALDKEQAIYMCEGSKEVCFERTLGNRLSFSEPGFPHR